MTRLSKLTLLTITALGLSGVASAAGGYETSAENNWRNSGGNLQWRNGDGTLCWRNNEWTPATAIPGCDGFIARAPKIVIPPPSPVSPRSVVAEPSAPPPAIAAPVKMTYSTDAFFDFDKAVVKAAGKAQLDDLVAKAKNQDIDVVIAVGYTDSIGAVAYNQKLSMQRAEAVKAYLVSKGIDKGHVVAEGKGESHPLADNRTAAGRAKNRRVEVELVARKPSFP